MLTVLILTNIRSAKDGHRPITTFSTVYEFASQNYLPDRNLDLKYH